MTKILNRSLAVLAASLLALPLCASANGWYGSVVGNLGYTSNINVTNSAFLGTGKITFKDPSFGGALVQGYKSGPMRYEAEFLYIHSKLSNFLGLTGPGFSGHTDVYAGMANVIYDYKQLGTTGLAPYAGVGLGVAHINTDLDVSGFKAKGHDNEFAYQGIVGVSKKVSNNAFVFVDYRYLGTTKAKHLGKRFQNHSVNVGVSFLFNGIA